MENFDQAECESLNLVSQQLQAERSHVAKELMMRAREVILDVGAILWSPCID